MAAKKPAKRENDAFKVDRRVADVIAQDFHIGVAQALLAVNPKSVQGLEMLAEALCRARRHEEALEVDLRLTQVKPRCPHAQYNLACSYANLGQVDEALEALRAAIKLGYRDFNYMMTDEDLENVRRDPRFKKLLDRKWGKRQP